MLQVEDIRKFVWEWFQTVLFHELFIFYRFLRQHQQTLAVPTEHVVIESTQNLHQLDKTNSHLDRTRTPYPSMMSIPEHFHAASLSGFWSWTSWTMIGHHNLEGMLETFTKHTHIKIPHCEWVSLWKDFCLPIFPVTQTINIHENKYKSQKEKLGFKIIK